MGSEVGRDNGCRVGGNFLPQGREMRAYVRVYTLSGVSIYSHGDLGQIGRSPNVTYCQMAAGDADAQPLFIKAITEGADLFSI